jgi:hypothetical protein
MERRREEIAREIQAAQREFESSRDADLMERLTAINVGLDVLGCTLQIAQYYETELELEASIKNSCRRSKAEGFIE